MPAERQQVAKVKRRPGVADSEDDVSFGGVWVEQQRDGNGNSTAQDGAKKGAELTASNNKGAGQSRKTARKTATPAEKSTAEKSTGEKSTGEKSTPTSGVWNITTKERRAAAPRKHSNFAKVPVSKSLSLAISLHQTMTYSVFRFLPFLKPSLMNMIFRVSVFPRTKLPPSVCQSPPDQPSTSTMTLMTSVVSRPGSETRLHQLNILGVNQSSLSTDPVLILHIIHI